ncbi:MAG: copper resistance system multicopper oxidase [Gammaproteobacteria bacterium]
MSASQAPDAGRRRFVQGLACSATALGLGLPPAGSAHAAGATPAGSPALLSGTDFDLRIGESRVNITGRERLATVVNGSLPAPVLRWREGDTVTIRVTNTLDEPTSIHWHGMLVPSGMDGVPGLSFRGIVPGETFTYRFPVRQSGTYWYHSHSGMQEQTGLYGALVVEPRQPEADTTDRDYVVLLSDWTDENPLRLMSNLKKQPDYYNYHQRTLADFFRDARRDGLQATLADRALWGSMRMNPTDLADVSAATYTYLMNGQSPAANWTGLFHPGERVRLRFINAAAMTLFDVRIPGLRMTVVAADGQPVRPVEVEEFRIGNAECYDVLVTPTGDQAYTIFAQSMDRTGYTRGTLAPWPGMTAAVPAPDTRVLLTMADMGGHEMSGGTAAHAGHDMSGMEMAGMDMSGDGTAAINHAATESGPGVDMRAANPSPRLDDPGVGLRDNGRRVLTYADLDSIRPDPDGREPSRTIELHLTGNMERYMWSFNGQKMSDAGPIRLQRGERVRFLLVNDTMMDHPIHLHGMWSDLEDEEGRFKVRKHTLTVKAGHRLSYRVTADAPGSWAYHCHLILHMEGGMFRTVIVADEAAPQEHQHG